MATSLTDIALTLTSGTAEDVTGSTNEYCLARDGQVNMAGDAVVVAMFREGPAVLLIRRAVPPFTGLWALPGGMRDVGEAMLRTVERELMEEVGVDASSAHTTIELGEIRSTAWDPRFIEAHVTGAAFVVDPQVPFEPGDDASSAAWVPVSELASGKAVLAFCHAQWLERTFGESSPLNDPAVSASFRALAAAARERNRGLIRQANERRAAGGYREIVLSSREQEEDAAVVSEHLCAGWAAHVGRRLPRPLSPPAPASRVTSGLSV